MERCNYIEDNHYRLMMTNAWQAIIKTNTLDFVAQNINSFMWSSEPKISGIIKKWPTLDMMIIWLYNEKYMQYLAQKGEEEFKKLFEKK